MIFITLGTQKFQFNRLLQQVDALIESGDITTPVFAQIGYSDYVPQHFAYERFLNRDAFTQQINTCNVVLTHGGTGSIITALKHGKKVVAVPRRAKHGEHVDDHQLQLLRQFEDTGFIVACHHLSDLSQDLAKARQTEFPPYQSNTGRIVESIEAFIAGM